MFNHELNERGHLILDDIQPRVGPEEAGGKADGEVDGVHVVALFLLGDVVEEGEEVVQEDLVLVGQLLEDSGRERRNGREEEEEKEGEKKGEGERVTGEMTGKASSWEWHIEPLRAQPQAVMFPYLTNSLSMVRYGETRVYMYTTA